MTASILLMSKHRLFSYEIGQTNHLRFCNSLRSSGVMESGEIPGYAVVPTILLVLEMFLLRIQAYWWSTESHLSHGASG